MGAPAAGPLLVQARPQGLLAALTPLPPCTATRCCGATLLPCIITGGSRDWCHSHVSRAAYAPSQCPTNHVKCHSACAPQKSITHAAGRHPTACASRRPVAVYVSPTCHVPGTAAHGQPHQCCKGPHAAAAARKAQPLPSRPSQMEMPPAGGHSSRPPPSSRTPLVDMYGHVCTTGGVLQDASTSSALLQVAALDAGLIAHPHALVGGEGTGKGRLGVCRGTHRQQVSRPAAPGVMSAGCHARLPGHPAMHPQGGACQPAGDTHTSRALP